LEITLSKENKKQQKSRKENPEKNLQDTTYFFMHAIT
jgi:hypothetical protein